MMRHSLVEVSCEGADPKVTGKFINCVTALRAAYSFENIRHNKKFVLKIGKRKKESCALPIRNFVAVAATL